MAISQTKKVLELIKRFNDGQNVLQNNINWRDDIRQEQIKTIFKS